MREHVAGALARILKYERANGRCPACDFLDELDSRMEKRFAGQFDALTKLGSTYCNQQRFWPLHGAGKPLWEFKEHDHRLYCFRRAVQEAVTVVLFNGWVKEKRGETIKESREVEKALALYGGFLAEYPGGNV